MTTEKICPIMSIGRTPSSRCISTACAWWDSISGCCSMASLPLAVDCIAGSSDKEERKGIA